MGSPVSTVIVNFSFT